MKRLLILFCLTVIQICSISSSFAQEAPVKHENQDIAVKAASLKNQGIVFYTEGKYIEALNCFERIDKNFLNSEILLLMSNSYSSLSNNKKSSELLIKAIEHDPDNSFLYYNLGILHYKNNNIKVSIDNFNKAISKNRNFAAAYYNLGICYYLTQDFKKAKNSFINAQKITPDNADICYGLILTCNALNDKQSAQKYLDIYSKITKKEGINEIFKNDTDTTGQKTALKKECPVSDREHTSLWKNLNFKRIKKLGF